jgi:molybdopterin-containing oxidoreductase family iron-sulfur binding subunit
MDASNTPAWWRSTDERDGVLPDAPDHESAVRKSFLGAPLDGLDVSRRSFLRLAGFSFAAAAAAGCSRAPTTKAIASIVPQAEMIPGRAYWIATTSNACSSGCGVLARCRDGRPVKLEGNPEHPLNKGGLCAACQASILALYDSHRLKGPVADGEPAGWDDVDAIVRARLAETSGQGGLVRVLTGTINGPSTLGWIDRFLDGRGDARHVMYDALSSSALLDANEAAYGVRAVPRYDLSRAKVIASFGADFLGAWISPEEHARGWAAGRRPDDEHPTLSRHWQFEDRLTLTGSNADRRVRTGAWETRAALARLVEALGGGKVASSGTLSDTARAAVDELVHELQSHRGESVVLCGSNDFGAQLLAARANDLLDNVGTTVDLTRPSLQRSGDDQALRTLVNELGSGAVGLLIVSGCNPAYDVPGFAEAITTAREQGLTVVTTSTMDDETAALADFVCPEPHDLERWDDAEPVAGLYSLSQPTVPPLRAARTLRESVARWLGDDRDDRELLAAYWREHMHPHAGGGGFDTFFHKTLHDGFVELPGAHAFSPSSFRTAALDRVNAVPAPAAPTNGALALALYPKIGLLDGRHAHNPWLQELPDPVSKVTWDNYACVSPATAERLGVETGDMLRLAPDGGPGNGAALELPTLVQVGQHDEVVAVALGYGRRGTDRFAKVGPQWLQSSDTVEEGGTVGVNAAPLLVLGPGGLRGDMTAVAASRASGHRSLACTQDHHSLHVPEHLAPKGGETRDAVQTVALATLATDPEHALHHPHEQENDLWPDDHEYTGMRWGMAIDLGSCTGCSACVLGCQAENNVPVVGRDEVRRHREMSWLRIDRYYQSDGDDVDTAHQPMMCQHCEQAPCETVCPVLATMHSSEGLNTQVYNRCVGTRYCANNCPYKTRRFNWFEYAREDQLQNMVLNPDVTIRSRGVMEKCSMCLQRIQEAKLEAKARGEEVRDGDIRTACQQSCPTQAITFGNLNDPESAVSKKLSGHRAYPVLAELNVRPSVRYLAAAKHGDGHATETKHG